MPHADTAFICEQSSRKSILLAVIARNQNLDNQLVDLLTQRTKSFYVKF
jgi:hypothetical protein